MPGTQPVYKLAPLEYRYALDAAASLLVGPRIYNNLLPLEGELSQRFATSDGQDRLWVEPQQALWQHELADIAAATAKDATLVIVASLLLARLTYETRTWPGQPLGRSIGGLQRLQGGLAQAGFKLENCYGLHSLGSIALNLASGKLATRRPALADSLHFRARRHYRTSGLMANFATVAMLVARKERGA